MVALVFLVFALAMTGQAAASPVSPAFSPHMKEAATPHATEIARRRKRRDSEQPTAPAEGVPLDPGDVIFVPTLPEPRPAIAAVMPPALPERRPPLPTDPPTAETVEKPAKRDDPGSGKTTKQKQELAEKKQSGSAGKPEERKLDEKKKADVPFGPPPPPPAWTEAEIAAANAACSRILQNIPAQFEKLDPIRDGVCGNPAPLRLKAFGGTPDVQLQPAATVNCALAAALHEWLTKIVQPRAKELLDASIIRLENASAYVCRTRYGSPTQRMSEHAFANAFDLSGFMTAKGERISVLEHWNSGDEKATFLRDIHAGACQIFGTTLGPEANAAHANHFHLDMAKRRRSLCDFAPGQQPVTEKAGTPIPMTVSVTPPLPQKKAKR